MATCSGSTACIGTGSTRIVSWCAFRWSCSTPPGERPGCGFGRPSHCATSLRRSLDIAGVPNRAGIPGTSLRPLLTGDSLLPTASIALSELSPHTQDRDVANRVPVAMKSLVDDSSHTIADAHGKVLLFGYPMDTAEANDLAVNPAVHQAAFDRLRDAMKRLGITWNTPPER